MEQHEKVFCVVNPSGGHGRAGRKWPAIETRLKARFPSLDHEMAESASHSTEVTRKALHDGHTLIVSIGGDGTANDVVNGFFDGGSVINPDAVFGLLSLGTGSDLRKSFGVPKSIDGALKVLEQGVDKRCDVGLVTCRCDDGEGTRYFINIADLGLGGDLVVRVNQSSKALGGFVSFLRALVVSLLGWRGKIVRLEIDGVDYGERKVDAVFVANGAFCGGGMWIAPGSSMHDGKAAVIIANHIHTLEALVMIPKLYRGTVSTHRKSEVLDARTLVATSDETVLLDVDGDQFGRLPARFEILPGAIRVRVAR